MPQLSQTNKITAMKLPRRVFNSPLILFANFHDGTSVNLIRLNRPYANGKMYAIHNNAENREKHNGMFKTLEKAKDSFYSVVREIDRESALLKMEMTINY